jgi:hypothetical protein
VEWRRIPLKRLAVQNRLPGGERLDFSAEPALEREQGIVACSDASAEVKGLVAAGAGPRQRRVDLELGRSKWQRAGARGAEKRLHDAAARRVPLGGDDCTVLHALDVEQMAT